MTRGHWSDIGGQCAGQLRGRHLGHLRRGHPHPAGAALPRRQARWRTCSDPDRAEHARPRQTGCSTSRRSMPARFVGDQRITALAEEVRHRGHRDGDVALARPFRSADARRHREDPRRRLQGRGLRSSRSAPPDWRAAPIPLQVEDHRARTTRSTSTTPAAAAQVRGGVNCPFSVTCNSTWFTVKAHHRSYRSRSTKAATAGQDRRAEGQRRSTANFRPRWSPATPRPRRASSTCC